MVLPFQFRWVLKNQKPSGSQTSPRGQPTVTREDSQRIDSVVCKMPGMPASNSVVDELPCWRGMHLVSELPQIIASDQGAHGPLLEALDFPER